MKQPLYVKVKVVYSC